MTELPSPQTDDLREYYASVRASDVPIDTLELRHPAFLDDEGHVTALRFVNDPFETFDATLEADAPMNAGEAVTFATGAFSVRPPDQNPPGLPTCDISVDNVARALMPWMEAAVAAPAPIDLTYRQYLASNSATPGYIAGGLTIKKAKAGIQNVTASAGYEDFINRPFPPLVYTRTEYPGLDR